MTPACWAGVQVTAERDELQERATNAEAELTEAKTALEQAQEENAELTTAVRVTA